MEGLLAIIFAILTMAISCQVVSTLWLWFVVPIFGLVALTPMQVFGLSTIIWCFTVNYKSMDRNKLTYKDLCERFLFVLLKYGMVIGIGYWVHCT